MLNRQDSSLSSSRRQATVVSATPPPETHNAKAIGCMSGIIQLFSKYQKPNKKRLTSGRKQEKCKPTSPAKAAVKASTAENKTENQIHDAKRLTCDIKVPRSPTLPPELRLSSAAASLPENARTPSSLVAKLMGLEDMCAAGVKKPALFDQEDPITEKRRRLLQALEKCNEDLESLKRIITAVQVQKADVRLQPPQVAVDRVHSGRRNGDSALDEVAEEVIPASAAAELTRSPLSSFSKVQNNTTGGAKRVSQQCKPTAAKKPGEDDEPITKLLNKSTTTESSLEMRRRATAAAASPPWTSRAMVESVEEVCSDIAWGEKREIGKIGVGLQDYLCKDLVEELVKELNVFYMQPLPLEACKKRLRF
ncbi:hypothetical protein BUALT_Bualt12G0045900 [Buddleja alternifolia]|uniref:DUF3741 domain-containing protein n=1 Tax=Buddleja alternifolia TaxID=168488 RepID=A0AAV6WZ81_9LAMI|nr:hypothetical protein BUALT_Bualt12G0045900 [Buddleja alternifolia]